MSNLDTFKFISCIFLIGIACAAALPPLTYVMAQWAHYWR